MVLVDGLPQESLTWTAIREALTPEDRARLSQEPPAGHGRWSHTEMLLALVADRVAQQTWVLGEWKTRPPVPEPVRRPGVDDRDAVASVPLQARVSPRTWEIAQALLNRQPIPDPS